MKYSQERQPSAFGELRPKQAVLAKLAPPHQRTVKDVAAEEGISPATLYHWRQQAHLTGGLFPDDGADPEGFAARDKFTAVMETAALNESACPARSRRVAILRGRHELYEAARRQHPTRWSPSLPGGGRVTHATGVTSEKSG